MTTRRLLALLMALLGVQCAAMGITGLLPAVALLYGAWGVRR